MCFRARGEFTLTGDRVDFQKFAIVGGRLSIKGRGAVHYDGRLDLKIEAAPFGKVLAAAGPIGDLLEGIVGEVLTHEVTGTLQNPQLIARPFDIGIEE